MEVILTALSELAKEKGGRGFIAQMRELEESACSRQRDSEGLFNTQVLQYTRKFYIIYKI